MIRKGEELLDNTKPWMPRIVIENKIELPDNPSNLVKFQKATNL